MSDLIQDPGRDASAAIRGFLYQVRTTVLRWLDLDNQTVLFCECGEDVNHVRGLLDSGGQAGAARQLLEQVKHRARRVTLRSPEVLEALANFHDTRTANAGLPVRFRYTTNAVAGQEQGVLFPEGLTGIEAWERVAQGTLDARAIEATVEAFRGIVRQATAPARSRRASQKFEAFREFVVSASLQELRSFLGIVEWSLGQPEHDLLPQDIEKRIVESGFASPAMAKRAADKLTVIALDTLAARGLKRLDRARLLAALEDAKFSDAEQATLNRLQQLDEQILPALVEIKSIASTTRQTVESLVRPVQETQLMVSEMHRRMAEMYPGAMAPIIVLGRRVAQLDVPPRPPRPCAPREHVVTSALSRLNRSTWLHIQGGAGMGKTHLARALGERERDGHLLWISLTSQHDTSVQHVFDQLVAEMVSLTGDGSWWAAYELAQASPLGMAEAVLRRLGKGTLIVVDDLPDLAAHRGLSHTLGGLAAACQVNGTNLLTTGQWLLTPEATTSLAPSSVGEIAVPPMEAADVLSMLRDCGAPEELVTLKVAEFLTGMCRGHPSLLSAAVRWLEARGWRLDGGALTTIIDGAATADEREIAARRVTSLVSDHDERELLYRVSLIGRAFGRAQVEAVAEVDPGLARPGELLDKLIGPWVNRLAGDAYEVSPLLGDVGRRYLPFARVKATCSALGHEILGRKRINANDAIFAASHLFAAEEWGELGALLFHVMSSVKTTAEARGLSLLGHIFKPGTWPNEIPHESRIVIRSLQVKIGRMAGDNVESLDDDLEALIAAAGTTPGERFATVWALLDSGPLLPHAPAGKAVARALRAVRMLRSQPGLMADMPPPPGGWEMLLRMPIATARRLEDVRAVLAVMNTMTAEEVAALASFEVTLLGFADGCWLHMSERPKEEQDWEAVLSALNDMEALAETRNCETLALMVTRARAITMANYLARLEEALLILRSMPELADPNLRFLQRYTIASILDDAGDAAGFLAACRWALAAGGDRLVALRFGAHVRATIAAEQLGHWDEAADWARAGLRYARKHNRTRFFSQIERAQLGEGSPDIIDSYVPALDGAELLGELATALWYGDRKRAAWAALQAAVHHLYVEWDLTHPRCREVFRKIGHSLGWFSAVCADGAPPSSTADGTPYTAPAPGMFAWRNPRLADLSAPISRAVLRQQLGRMAGGLCLRKSALRDFGIAVGLAGEEGRLWPRSLMQTDRAMIAAALYAFDIALDAGLETVKGVSVTGELIAQGEEFSTSGVDPDAAWQQLTADRRKSAQSELFLLVVAPALASALASRENPVAMRGHLTELRAAFEKRKADLLDPPYWEAVVDAAVRVWEPVGPEQLVALVNDLAADDVALGLTDYLAISENAWFPPGYALKAQSIVLTILIDREAITRVTTLPDFCKYLLGYWHRVAENKGFELRAPRVFKERMTTLQGECDLSSACHVLLWAEEATGAPIPEDARVKIKLRGLSSG